MACKRFLAVTLVVFLSGLSFGQEAMTVRLKDIAYLQGVRENQLVGFGLITGLEGNGDSANSTLLKNVLSNLLSSFSISMDSEDINSRNTAVVMVTADIPAFVRPGDRISVHVSSLWRCTESFKRCAAPDTSQGIKRICVCSSPGTGRKRW